MEQPAKFLPPPKRGVRRTSRTVDRTRTQFLSALRLGASVTKACGYAGIARQTVYDWRYADEEFAALWDDAIEYGTDRLEDEAFRRAHDGVKKPIVYQGRICREDDVTYFTRICKVVGDDQDLLSKLKVLSGVELDLFGSRIGVERDTLYVAEHSDSLMALLLRARRPEVYRDRVTTEVTGPNGTVPIQKIECVIVDPTDPTDRGS